jgi:hypothetical protein
VPFLRIVSDARSGALGDAGIAISPDANAVHFNDSKLVFADKEVGVSATYTPWLRALGLNDVYLAYLSGYVKQGDLQAIGFSLRYFSLGEINFTDINGEPLGNGRPNEFEVKASYSRKLTEKFSAAIGANFIPTNMGIGVAWEFMFDEYNSLTIISDVNKLLVPSPCFEDCDTDQDGVPDWKQEAPISGIFTSFSDAPRGFSEELQEFMLSFGLEYWYAKQFAVRAGYYTEHRLKG